MADNPLEQVFFDGLRDVYNAENQILKALPKLAKTASSDELRQAFEKHLEQTRGQVDRLDQIFNMHQVKSRGKKCLGMEGIIEEGKEEMKEKLEPSAMDAVLIAAAQKVEHYEIATYGTLRTWAQELGFNQEANLLQQTLDEEGDTDKKLTRLAESRVNIRAEQGGDGQMYGDTRRM